MALLHRGYAELGAMGFRYRAVNQSVEVTRTRIADGEGYIAVRDDESVGTHLIRLYERRGVVSHAIPSRWIRALS